MGPKRGGGRRGRPQGAENMGPKRAKGGGGGGRPQGAGANGSSSIFGTRVGGWVGGGGLTYLAKAQKIWVQRRGGAEGGRPQGAVAGDVTCSLSVNFEYRTALYCFLLPAPISTSPPPSSLFQRCFRFSANLSERFLPLMDALYHLQHSRALPLIFSSLFTFCPDGDRRKRRM